MGGAHEQYNARSAGTPIVLRAADPSSRRYITVLPATLDALLLKARSLFPVPPGHTPYITLDQDEQTVILEDALPFLREREVLVFRWSPDTPRKAHGKSVKWDSSITNTTKVAGSSTPSSSTSRGNRMVGSSVEAGSSSPSSSAITAGLSRSTSTSSSSSSGTSSSQNQLTQAQQHRAAHARRVLEEQRRLQEEEEAEAAHRKAEEQQRAEEKRCIEEAQKAEKAKDEQIRKECEDSAAEESTAQRQEWQQHEESPTASGQPIALTPTRQPDLAATTAISIHPLSPTDLAVSGSSPPPYSSPRKASADREVTPPTCATDNDNIQSSPLVASPTREIHAAVVKASMSPHGDKLVAGRSPISVRRVDEDAEKRAEDQVHDIVMENVELLHGETKHSAEKDNTDAVMTASPIEEMPKEANPQAEAQNAKPHSRLERETDIVYSTMRSVIDNLRNHPSNVAFRDPMPLDYTSFAEAHPDRRGAIDLYIMLSRITTREYGTMDATPSPLEAFTSDLKRMWSLARAFYGPRSPQGQCAAVLDKFAEVFMTEWKLRPVQSNKSTPTAIAGRGAADGEKSVSNSAGRGTKSGRQGVAADEKEEARRKAAALMASWNSSIGATSATASPGARGEKRGLIGGEEDGSRSTPGGNRLMPFHRRPAKQQRTGSYTGEKAVDMVAFHRAIMGDKVALPTRVATNTNASDFTENASSHVQEHANALEEEKENQLPAPATSEAASEESRSRETQDQMQLEESILASAESSAREPQPEPLERPVSDSLSPFPSTSSEVHSSITDLSNESVTSTPMVSTPLASTRPQRRRNPTRGVAARVSDSPVPLVSKSGSNNNNEHRRTRQSSPMALDLASDDLAAPVVVPVPVPAAAESRKEEPVQAQSQGDSLLGEGRPGIEEITALPEALVAVEEEATQGKRTGTSQEERSELVASTGPQPEEEEAEAVTAAAKAEAAAAAAAAAMAPQSAPLPLPTLPRRAAAVNRTRRSLGGLAAALISSATAAFAS